MWIFFFIGSYRIYMDVIHLFILFEHWCHMHYLNMNAICLFILFKHKCCMFIHVVYTRKSCMWLLFLNNAWYLCLNDMNPWNNKFHTYLEWTHETYKFVMRPNITNLPGFIGLYKFHAQSNFHRFTQKLQKFHVMVNMNDICRYSIS